MAWKVVDPDGGVNFAQKKAALGLVAHSSLEETFPTAGFKTDLSILPRIRYVNIWKYLIDDVELKRQLSTEKPIVKGYNFFKSGHVLQAFVKKDGDMFYVKSKVSPSMKKGVYTVKIVLDSSSCIQQASCHCPAGVDGRCNHLAATLFMLESLDDNSNKENCRTEMQSENIPCTSKPCTWNIPNKKKSKASPIQSMDFIKHEWGKKKKHSPRNILPDPGQHKATPTELDSFYKKVKMLEEETGMKTGLSFILPQQITSKELPLVDSNPNKDKQNSRWKMVSPNKSLPLSLEEIKLKGERTKQRLLSSAVDRTEIMQQTVDQHQSVTWYDVRQPRITASRCKRCLLKPSTSPTKAIAELLSYNTPVQTKAMRDGIASEASIIKRYELISGNVVQGTGFWISSTHPFLGASPDGIVNKSCLLEVKKVNSREGESFEETLCRLGIYKRGRELQINTNHKYYYQIQQQLFCTDYNVCHFVVSNGIWVYIEIVWFDKVFWNTVLEKLQTFYFDHIFPELVYPNVKYGCPRWGKYIAFPV